MLAAYIVTRRRDVANGRLIEKQESRHEAYCNELKYLQGDFSAFDDGSRYADTKHPFTYDMDIFAPLAVQSHMPHRDKRRRRLPGTASVNHRHRRPG